MVTVYHYQHTLIGLILYNPLINYLLFSCDFFEMVLMYHRLTFLTTG